MSSNSENFLMKNLNAYIYASYLLITLTCTSVIADAQVKSDKIVTPNLFSLTALDEIRTVDHMENHVSIHPIRNYDKNFLKITCSSRSGNPQVHFKTLNVQSGERYSFLISAQPSEKAEAAIYIESPKGNVVWPGLKIIKGAISQTFTVPDGVNEITFGFIFLNPDPDEEILVEEIGFYKATVNPSDWDPKENQVVQQFINTLGDLSKYHAPEKSNKVILPPNLFSLSDLSEIKNPDNSGSFAKLRIFQKSSDQTYLKITCASITGAPHVHFKTLIVKPGQTYSYLISSLSSAAANAYIYVESPTAGNVVWPGQQIIGGTVCQTFRVPDGATEITLGLIFLKPNPDESLLIEEIGAVRDVVEIR